MSTTASTTKPGVGSGSVIKGSSAASALKSRRRREEALAQQSTEEYILDASVAVSELSDLLNQFTSNKIGSVIPSTSTLYTDYYNDIDEFNDEDDVGQHQSPFQSPNPVEWLRDSDLDNDNRKNNNDRMIIPSIQNIHDRISRQSVGASGTKITSTAASLDRADTPVMSNSSSHKKQQPPTTSTRRPNEPSLLFPQTPATAITIMDVANDDDEDEVPFNVQSPWVNNSATLQTPTVSKTPLSSFTSGRNITTTSARKRATGDEFLVSDFRQYYDSVCSFVHSKRNLFEGSNTQQLLEKENRIDIAFLQQLNAIAYRRWSCTTAGADEKSNVSNAVSAQEGNFWYLLATLRSLGIPAILWDDDPASKQQYHYSIQGYVQNLASKYVEYTPQQLLSDFNDSTKSTKATLSGISSPLVLQRRQRILQWLEYCFTKKLSPSIVSASRKNSTVHQDGNVLQEVSPNERQYRNHLSKQGFDVVTDDVKLLQDSMSLILAGRLDDAQQLARNQNMDWRAALWDGGRPHGYEVVVEADHKQTHKPTGNVKRALWRRMTWKLAESLSTCTSSTHTNDYEAAIAAILSSHFRCAFDNPVLNKSWDQGLFVAYRAMIDRTIDEILHCHNNFRRQLVQQAEANNGNRCHGFPGITEYEQHEREQLQATSDIASWNDATVVQLLNNRSFQQINQPTNVHNPIVDATTSILIGKGAITAYISKATDEIDEDVTYLRFMTHLALFLDSLSVSTKTSTTPAVTSLMDAISEWKNELLIQYINYLSSNDSLWYMMVVYASLLPTHTILDYLPNYLIGVESTKDRTVIVQQLQEFLTINKLDFDLDVLRKVVRLVLFSSSEGEDEINNGTVLFSNNYRESSIEHLDLQKMNAVLWLVLNDEHVGDALIAANILLRQFLLYEDSDGSNKLTEAKIFVNEILPRTLLDRVSARQSKPSTTDIFAMEDSDYPAAKVNSLAKSIEVEHAQSDFVAIQSYLLAMDGLQRWVDIISSTSPIIDTTEESATDRTSGKIDKSKLNHSELSIAANLDHRTFIDEKRNATAKVVAAADTVETLLLEILKYQGGFLLTDDETIIRNIDNNDEWSEEMLRRRIELSKLRSLLLPNIVSIYGNVCTTTARWMYTSLNQAIEKHRAATKDKGSISNQSLLHDEVVRLLDDSVAHISDPQVLLTGVASPVSPQYWTQKLFDLAEICSSDTFGVKSAFENSADYENLVQLLAENAINHLLYANH